MSAPTAIELPEHNLTGIDFNDRAHFTYVGPPIIDIHAHVMQTEPTDSKDGPPPMKRGPGASTDQAGVMLDVGKEFGVVRTYSMCLPDDIAPLRARYGDRIGFNGSVIKRKPDD